MFIRTRPKMAYLYRAVDKKRRTVESLLQTGHGIAAAMAFFREAVASCAPHWPRKITLDGHKPSHSGLCQIRREDPRSKYVHVHAGQYLNHKVEQGHRPIKSRCRPTLAFKSYRTAAVTLANIELAHRIRKSQFKSGTGGWSRWPPNKSQDKSLGQAQRAQSWSSPQGFRNPPGPSCHALHATFSMIFAELLATVREIRKSSHNSNMGAWALKESNTSACSRQARQLPGLCPVGRNLGSSRQLMGTECQRTECPEPSHLRVMPQGANTFGWGTFLLDTS